MMQKPNILMILSDQHRLDCVGKSHRYEIKTPNLDRMAKEGLWFSNAYTPCPLCCPARQSYLSGKRPEKLGALWNYDLSLKIPSMTPDMQHFTRDMHDSGYFMGYIGKWHVSQQYTPLAFGFDQYISLEDYENEIRKIYPDRKFKNGFFGELDPVELEDSRTHWQAKKTIEMIEENTKSAPWYIQLNFTEPHLPCQPVEKFMNLYKDKAIEKWGSFEDDFADKPYIQRQQLLNWDIENYSWEDWEPIVKRYYAIISQMDDAIGQVIDYLTRNNMLENTLIIYTSDHGDMCGSHRMIDKHYVMYDDIVRVPLIMQWKGHIAPDTECGQYVYNMLDLPPTLTEITRTETSCEFDGSSLVELMKQKEVPDWRSCVMATYNGQQFGLYTERMLRKGRYKYIWNTTDVDEFYDMEQDPWEMKNLIHEEQLQDTIREYRLVLLEELEKAQDDLLIRSTWMRNQLKHGKKI